MLKNFKLCYSNYKPNRDTYVKRIFIFTIIIIMMVVVELNFTAFPNIQRMLQNTSIAFHMLAVQSLIFHFPTLFFHPLSWPLSSLSPSATVQYQTHFPLSPLLFRSQFPFPFKSLFTLNPLPAGIGGDRKSVV